MNDAPATPSQSLEKNVTFARRVFAVASAYGLVTLVPGYVLERQIGIETPPPLTHPEYYYGFLGVALAWQVMFFAIARDPLRYRGAMPIAFLEKLGFGGAVLVLSALQRVPTTTLAFGLIDLTLGVLFLVAYTRTRSLQPGRPVQAGRINPALR